MAFRDIEEKAKWKPPVGVYCRCHVGMEETKREEVEEIKYPGPEAYKQFNCKKSFGYQMECYRCAEWSNVVYQSDDSANQLCPDCYYEYVVEPARKETKEEPVGEIKYPGPRQYVRIRSVSTTYTCRTCKRVGDAIWSARAMCNHEATQICSDCYHEHVVGPAKEEKVEEKIEYPSKEYYELSEFAELSNCYTCQADVRTFYRIRGDGLRVNAPRKTRWLCSDCYEKHVVGSELAPMKKVEPPKPAVEYPTSDHYRMDESMYKSPWVCHTCHTHTRHIHALVEDDYFSANCITRILCPDCFTANVKDPEPAPIEAYDAIKNYPLLNGIVDPS